MKSSVDTNYNTERKRSGANKSFKRPRYGRLRVLLANEISNTIVEGEQPISKVMIYDDSTKKIVYFAPTFKFVEEERVALSSNEMIEDALQKLAMIEDRKANSKFQ